MILKDGDKTISKEFWQAKDEKKLKTRITLSLSPMTDGQTTFIHMELVSPRKFLSFERKLLDEILNEKFWHYFRRPEKEFPRLFTTNHLEFHTTTFQLKQVLPPRWPQHSMPPLPSDDHHIQCRGLGGNTDFPAAKIFADQITQDENVPLTITGSISSVKAENSLLSYLARSFNNLLYASQLIC